MEINPENRSSINMVSRCCSFCRRAGHNILTCNSWPLRNFEEKCMYTISNFDIRSNIVLNFKNFLLSEALYDTNIVKSFAIRYCSATARDNINRCIEKITDYFRPVIENRLRIEMNRTTDEINQMTIDILHNRTSIRRHPLIHRGDINYTEPIFSSRNFAGINDELLSFGNTMLLLELIASINRVNEQNLNRKFNITTKLSIDNKDETNELCECGICYEENENKNFVKLDCGHQFCKDCTKESLKNEKRQHYYCALCRKEIKNFEMKDESVIKEFDELIFDD